MYFVKKRTGLSLELVATLFSASCRGSMSRHVRTVRKALTQNFVPFNIGFEAVTREDVINKYTTEMARILFADGKRDVMILIMDGTYIFLGIYMIYNKHCLNANHYFNMWNYSIALKVIVPFPSLCPSLFHSTNYFLSPNREVL